MTIEKPIDTRARYESEFGQALGGAIHAFWCRLLDLHRRWKDYETLYRSDIRISVLNEFAPSFFARHQQMTFECVIMALARLTDTECTGKFKNLSIAYLLILMEPKVQVQMQPFADDAQQKALFAREWRNKRYAHCDVEDAVNQAMLINSVTHTQIDEAIIAINKFVEQVHLKCGPYSLCNLDHAYRSNDFGGAHLLLGRLHEANKAREARMTRTKQGDIRAEDYKDDNDPVWKDLRRV